ncbi:hypothetical protein [Variovorax sp. J22R115]|uniref:hypothetical protein n=1 Tax=Variovorax sp. J22R115 TaxID=3053509 RepID=UPI002577FCD9|nr:hypothetical protein [Variovorax sp. J22R115]MDM0047937.1 hypothetical protein [Variovorax sp. J22R115]
MSISRLLDVRAWAAHAHSDVMRSRAIRLNVLQILALHIPRKQYSFSAIAALENRLAERLQQAPNN